MYKIGEFSRVTGITVKALRYYHDEGILIPQTIDDMTGYRLYESEQIDMANSVKMLRDCTFSVKEIKDILTNINDLEDLPYFMEEKIDMVNLQITELRKIKTKLVNEKEKQKEVKNMNDYVVTKKTYDDMEIISVRYRGRYEECGEYIGQLYKNAKGQMKDVPFNMYYDEDMNELADIEVCLPVKREIRTSGDITFSNLKGQEGLSVIHIGPYDHIGGAYKALWTMPKIKVLSW